LVPNLDFFILIFKFHPLIDLNYFSITILNFYFSHHLDISLNLLSQYFIHLFDSSLFDNINSLFDFLFLNLFNLDLKNFNLFLLHFHKNSFNLKFNFEKLSDIIQNYHDYYKFLFNDDDDDDSKKFISNKKRSLENYDDDDDLIKKKKKIL
jgi:hypothetical protein